MSEESFDQPLLDVMMMLADSAQVSDGKLYLLGGGISVIGPRRQPLAVALLAKIPWDRANIPHEWKLELLDQDGAPVMAGERPVMVGGKIEAGRPAGLRPGSPLHVPMAINFSALPVEPGNSYQFRLAIDGTSEPEWNATFAVREQPAKKA